MGKIDFKAEAERLRKTIKDPAQARSISTGAEMTTPTEPDQFVVMPAWWQEATTGLLGIPFGYEILIAGTTDSGKTSCVIQAIRSAQEQGVHVILGDTERKTTKARLEAWGVRPEDLARVQATHLEQLYSGIEKWIDLIKDKDPEGKILVIIDSLGNTPSFRESEVEDMHDSSQPGVSAKINKRGLKRIIPRLERDQIALLVITQTYDNYGSHGKTNAGGQGPSFFSAFTFQTQRVAFLEKKLKGESVRYGARVKWTVTKDHLVEKAKMVKKATLIDITADGMTAANTESE